MDLTALIISGLALAVAIGGTYLSNKRSKEALAESKNARLDAHWSALQVAVQRLIGFDPVAEPIQDRLTNLRIAMLSLVDHLDIDLPVDAWLDAERVLGATFGREALEAARPNDSVDQRVANLEQLMSWAHALSSNLRRFRSVGFDASTLELLQANAEALVRQTHERHGWELPPRENSRIQPLN